jgi:hypothetical protein
MFGLFTNVAGIYKHYINVAQLDKVFLEWRWGVGTG